MAVHTTTPAPPTKAKPPIKSALFAGLIGGVFGAAFSATINFLAVGLPDSEALNAMNHGLTGLFSGFAGGFAAVLTYSAKERKRAAAALGAGGPVITPPAVPTAAPAPAMTPVQPQTAGGAAPATLNAPRPAVPPASRPAPPAAAPSAQETRIYEVPPTQWPGVQDPPPGS